MLVPLTGGYYQAQSLIASAQSCINLYPEKNPQDSPVPMTTYLTPGLTSTGFNSGLPIRWKYEASNGNLYSVYGNNRGSALYVSVPNTGTNGIASTSLINTFNSTGTTPVSMADNGLVLVIVDGTTSGWVMDLQTISGISAGTITAGSGYTNGTYTLINLTGGTGKGAIATITVAGNIVTAVSITTNGYGYVVGDVLSGTFGGGSGFQYTLTSLTNSLAPITDPNFLGALKVDILDTFFLFNVTGTNQWYISLSEANFEMFAGTTGALLTGSIAASGNSSVTNNTYSNTSLTGGTGTGATANIVVSGNNVTSVTPVLPGSGYVVGDQLSATLPGNAILTVSFSAGSGYTNGSYTSVSLLGGFGSGATANITVSGGIVTNVQINNGGANYAGGDTLTVSSIPGGTGFSVTVATIGGSGFIFTVDTVAGTAFDPTDIATKITYPDPIVTLIVMHAEIWLIGTMTTEVWYNAGAADFTFQLLPGVFIEHGCAAQYSVAKQDLSIYWLSKDKQGQCIVLKGNGYAAHRISTFAIENEFSSYSTISDAQGWTYQQRGHTFYVLKFPTADKTWVFDESTQIWHERMSLQTIQNGAFIEDGNLHSTIYNVGGVCGGTVYVDDGLGNMWLLDPNNYTENGVAIPRIRAFPHLLNSMKRVSYTQFIADMEVGTDDPTVTNDGTSSASPPMVNLRWSDNRGRTYGSYVQQSLGALGKYLTTIQWRRLGRARDRVFELSWSVPTKTALNGAWVEFTSSNT